MNIFTSFFRLYICKYFLKAGDGMKNKRLHTEIFAGVLSAALLIGSHTQGQAAWGGFEADKEAAVEMSESILVSGEDTSYRNSDIYLKEGKRMKVRRPLMAQLNEALSLERQMEVCQEPEEREAYLALYERMLTEALTGGYSQEEDGTGNASKADLPQVDRQMADYYRDFINANGGSRTAEILKDCCLELEAWDYQPDNEDMEAFRKKLPELIGKWSRMEKGSISYFLWKLTGWA